MSNLNIKVVICESSSIIRSGLSSTFKRIQGYNIQTLEVHSPIQLVASSKHYKPDIIVVNPVNFSAADINKLRDSMAEEQVKIIAIVAGMFDDSLKTGYDETIGLYDSLELIRQKLNKLFCTPEEDGKSNENDNLSLREKEILSLIVRGLTNKEIASNIYLSTHTVITHRRNITRKLGIHSTSGLTIYAIINKLIEINDIKLSGQE